MKRCIRGATLDMFLRQLKLSLDMSGLV